MFKNSKTVLKESYKAKWLRLPDFKTYIKAALINMALY